MHPTDDKKYPIKTYVEKDFCVRALSSRKLEINDSMKINSFVFFPFFLFSILEIFSFFYWILMCIKMTVIPCVDLLFF